MWLEQFIEPGGSYRRFLTSTVHLCLKLVYGVRIMIDNDDGGEGHWEKRKRKSEKNRLHSNVTSMELIRSLNRQ